MGLEARDENTLTLEGVKIKLMDVAERKKESSNGEQQIYASFNSRPRTNNHRSSNIICYQCNKPGHYRNSCPTLGKTNNYKHFQNAPSRESNFCSEESSEFNDYSQTGEKGKNSRREEEISEFLSYSSITTENEEELTPFEWVVDSGATAHMCHDKLQLKNYEDFQISKTVIFANGSKSKAIGRGDIVIKIPNQSLEYVIKSVILVPDIKVNLLSVSELCMQNYNVTFEEDTCVIGHNEATILKGKINEGIFKVKIYQNTEQVNATCIHGWHQRFGHRNIETIKKMFEQKEAKNLIINKCHHDDFCEVCQTCNLKRKTYPRINDKQSNKIFELIHADLCGPIEPTTKGGGKYMLILTDDFSRYSYLEILKSKTDVNESIKKYIKHFGNKYNYYPCSFRSDGGKEFENSELNKFFNYLGIHHQLSTPYTPEQNGVSERVNQTLVRMTKSLLVQNNLPRNLWGEAAATACYLHNRITHSHTGTTPFKLWEGRIPNVDNLRVMGSKAFLHIPKQMRHKMDNASQIGILLGYSTRHKGYRILNIENQKISISNDVSFQEFDQEKDVVTDKDQYYEVDQPIRDPAIDTEITENTPRKSERQNKGQLPIRYRD